MNTWGFVIYTSYEEEIYSDFGYETEEDAEDAMQKYFNNAGINKMSYRVSVEQRWEDIEDLTA